MDPIQPIVPHAPNIPPIPPAPALARVAPDAGRQSGAGTRKQRKRQPAPPAAIEPDTGEEAGFSEEDDGRPHIDVTV